jgi:riboflavin kinase/FMN adenylyltransferase
MKIFYNLDNLTTIKNPVVTTGSFDGVHIGHKTIIDRLNQLAKNINGESVLITFHPHPRRVLYPDNELLLINSQKEKIELLKQTGLNNLIIINFTIEFSKLSSEDFITKILIEKLHAKIIVVGFNHHFGHNREGNYNYLYEMKSKYNFEVEEIPEQDIENESVSSTKIRKALQSGNIQSANAYLNHQYMITGKIVDGNPIYHEIGLPTVRLIIEEEYKLIPPDGIYAIHSVINNKYLKGMMIKNTLYDKSIEIHFFNEKNINIESFITIYLHKRIETEIIFTNPKNYLKNIIKASNNISELIY